MQGARDFAVDSPLWEVATAVLAGQADAWDDVAEEVPPEQRPLLQELRSIAAVIAAAEASQRAAGADEGRPLSTGDVWGPLEILELIGEGAYGEVFRAREPRLDRQVAVKFYRPHRLSRTQLTSDVIEEGRLLARVRHPNVVTVHGAKQVDGRFGIWMEFIEGETLEEIVTGRGPLSVDDAAGIGRDLCRGLSALHDAGILHRDLKARNVMREESGRVVLMDLGISCEVEGDVPVRQYGTPLYAAPEVLRDSESSRQGDIYSLGVLLFFLVSGRYPVTGATLSEILDAHATGRPESLAAVRPDLPAAFVRTVEQALAGDLDDRFATAGDLERALAEAVGDAGSDGPGRSRDRTRPHSDNQQALDQYLLGRHFFDLRYKGGMPRALEAYRKAVTLDPEFALAHVGIADCLVLASYWQYLRPRDGFPAAQAAAEQALAIDPALGEAYVPLAWSQYMYDWDFEAAERSFWRALRLAPGAPRAREIFAIVLAALGREHEALSVIDDAGEPHHTSLIVAARGEVLYISGRFEEAIPILQLGLESDPDSLVHNCAIGSAFWFIGKEADALRHIERAVAVSGGEFTWAVSELAFVFAQVDREPEAIALVDGLDVLSRRRYVSAYHRLMPWIALGRNDKWEPLLEEAIEERDPILVWLRALGPLDPVLARSGLLERIRPLGLMG